MDFSEIVLRIPRARLSSAAWILSQPPDVVADSLEVAPAAHRALARELEKSIAGGRGQLNGLHSAEDVLVHAHRTLELGSLHEASEGCHQWKCTPSVGCDEMRCLIYVTRSQRNDVKDELTKHRGFVEAGVVDGQVTCGLFISLACHIPNFRSIEMCTASDVPLVYFSRNSNDDISESTLATLALRVMSQLSQRSSQRNEKHSSLVDAADFMKRQLSHLDLIDEQIKSAGQMQRNLLDLREGVVRDLLTLRAPGAGPVEVADNTGSSFDRWSTDGGEEFLKVFKAAKRGKRYPTAADVQLEGLALFFVEQNPDAFMAAKEKMKRDNRSQTRGVKRKAAKGLSADEDDEVDVDEAA
jgi:hypothetical protein